MNGTLQSELRLLARDVPIGATEHRFACPKCNGGRHSDRSFSITRVDATTILYCCHRATCGFDGCIGRAFGDFECSESIPHRTSDENPGQFQGRPFRGDVQRLGGEWLSELQQLYGISGDDASELGWLEEIDSGRLVVPIRSPLGETRGVQTRNRRRSSGKPGDIRKTLDYPQVDGPWLAWFLESQFSPSSTIVLVEDVISAAKVALAGHTGVSLMGSHLSLEGLEETQEQANNLVLALDRDATSKALRLASR